MLLGAGRLVAFKGDLVDETILVKGLVNWEQIENKLRINHREHPLTSASKIIEKAKTGICRLINPKVGVQI